jgi:hypothetical protein
MRLTRDGQTLTITLSRRNLQSILAKLDGHPPDSACTIFNGPFEGYLLVLKGEDDDVHYTDEAPGLMHPATERQM